jgi:hypothetical protein
LKKRAARYCKAPVTAGTVQKFPRLGIFLPLEEMAIHGTNASPPFFSAQSPDLPEF